MHVTPVRSAERMDEISEFCDCSSFRYEAASITNDNQTDASGQVRPYYWFPTGIGLRNQLTIQALRRNHPA